MGAGQSLHSFLSPIREQTCCGGSVRELHALAIDVDVLAHGQAQPVLRRLQLEPVPPDIVAQHVLLRQPELFLPAWVQGHQVCVFLQGRVAAALHYVFQAPVGHQGLCAVPGGAGLCNSQVASFKHNRCLT